ncbi:hypothetical protein FV232_22315 [Methylobacterium sp. WL30]|uniref:hypothetical protein n=1 Tax=unclassified Methylobacterium TaxID=2615210 RepID=UPI0011CBDFA5|nr:MULTISPECIES: hypothetical protein [unclassified Methylobacterium]TXM93930.1 hypothetical protein FV223_06565 [Methylobacterium sp. WL116]TXN41398.1 hypothetical protein FV225_02610 [Methylobacterium sp. WL93]TXN49780.1 hypothetical protein FV227_14900 [Methylobacterium sp. WL119]TXN63832.1 hypothetical protein FV232_22315 [Methylobacterium sp. WL30]
MSEITDTFATAEDGTLDLIKREADAYLGAQLTVALAGNQRAMTFFGFLATAASVIATASVTVLVTKPDFLPFGIIGLAVVAGLLAAMVLANLSAMPDAFSYVGNTPAGWVADVKGKKPLGLSKAEALEDSAECITANRAVLERAAKLIRWAMWTAWGSISLGALVSLVTLGQIMDASAVVPTPPG